MSVPAHRTFRVELIAGFGAVCLSSSLSFSFSRPLVALCPFQPGQKHHLSPCSPGVQRGSAVNRMIYFESYSKSAGSQARILIALGSRSPILQLGYN